MPSSQSVNWQPISQLPLIASMIDGALRDTAEHLKTLTEARTKPHVRDDATIDRVERVYGEQRDFVEIFAEQLRRWRADGRSAEQRRELKRLEGQNSRLHELTDDVLALAVELRKGTIERVMGMSDVELGLRAVLGMLPARG